MGAVQPSIYEGPVIPRLQLEDHPLAVRPILDQGLQDNAPRMASSPIPDFFLSIEPGVYEILNDLIGVNVELRDDLAVVCAQKNGNMNQKVCDSISTHGSEISVINAEKKLPVGTHASRKWLDHPERV